VTAVPPKTPPPAWTFADAYRILGSRQKPGVGVPFYTRVVNRRLGRVGAAAASAARLSPNVVTLVGAALWVAALAILCSVPTSPGVTLLVVALLVLSFGLDSADGQLARLTARSSAAGEWLDHVIDAARHVAVHLAILVALYRFADLDPLLLLVPLGFCTVATTRFIAQILAEQLRPRAARRRPAPPGHGGIGALLQLPADTGVLNASLLLLPFPHLFISVYGVLAAGNLVLLTATVRRRMVELSRLDSEAAR
jgi:phosphatidylglycerophosphate synthase